MPAPYSLDLRWRIVHACEQGTESQREVAELFQVSLATIENILRLYRRTGDVVPRKRLACAEKKERPCHRTGHSARTSGTPSVPPADRPISGQKVEIPRRVRLEHRHDTALRKSRARQAGP